MPQWAQRLAMDIFQDVRGASDENYVGNKYFYIILSILSKNLPNV